MQCILSALVAIIIAFAPVFNIPLTVVPPKGELPHESEPAPSELSAWTATRRTTRTLSAARLITAAGIRARVL